MLHCIFFKCTRPAQNTRKKKNTDGTFVGFKLDQLYKTEKLQEEKGKIGNVNLFLSGDLDGYESILHLIAKLKYENLKIHIRHVCCIFMFFYLF